MNEIPFRLYKGLVYISATLSHNGQTLTLPHCIFDTGAAGTTFDVDDVSPIGIQALPESRLRRLVTVGGYQTVFTYTIDALTLGEATLSQVGVEIGNLQSKFSIQGIIGTDVMQHFDWSMKFSNSTLSIHSA